MVRYRIFRRTQPLDCKLARDDGVSLGIIAEVTSVGLGGTTVYSDSTISFATVDNSAYGYGMMV
ncbi:MAG: hypothetical protein ACC655_07280, partial [Rhodothermia bacterium]